MAMIITLKGPNPGLYYPLAANPTMIGRHTECAIWLDSPAVSRHHAQITQEDDAYYVEDLDSSNGTYVNGDRLENRYELSEDDTVQIGPFVLALRLRPSSALEASDSMIRAQVNALGTNDSLLARNAEQKLRVMMEIAQGLGRTLDVETVLDKLLEQLFRLFPQTDRGMIILCENDDFGVRAQHSRATLPKSSRPGSNETIVGVPGNDPELAFSRSLVKRALEDEVGLLSEDVTEDNDLPKTATLLALNLRSVLCAPLIGLDRTKLGVIQLDCMTKGSSFRPDDLELLTTLGLQLAGVLENAALHEELLREERLKQELALARNIQQSFMPEGSAPGSGSQYEIFAKVHPAREVSGDLYDFFEHEDGRLAFFLGDVCGKGMPAALFMIAVRTLTRHLTRTALAPAEMLVRLNEALVKDNPTTLFVTMVHGIYDPRTGEVVIVSGGQPLPLLRRRNGTVEEIAVQPSMMLGYDHFARPPAETQFVMEEQSTLVLYSDGLTEAKSPEKDLFGTERLKESIRKRCATGLAASVQAVCDDVKKFTQQTDLQDDQTLLLLRHRPRN